MSDVNSFLVFGAKLDALFKCALLYAEHGLRVWFITTEKFNELPGNLPLLDKEWLQLITFLYLKDVSDVLNHLSNIHLWHQCPQVLIINSFENYYSDNHSYNAYMLSMIIDAGMACARKHSCHRSYVVVFYNKTVSCNFQHLLDLYIRHVLKYTNDYELLMRLEKDII
ncbi:hypothetical protein FQA39_LY16443 [Lamprigera yunnana]|nr:hypothetical protein FQA39_LY16443 [Lamprigera yunnana]